MVKNRRIQDISLGNRNIPALVGPIASFVRALRASA